MEEKGQMYLIEALQRLANRWPNLRCVFIGEGPLEARLKQRAKQLAVDRHCRFTGIRIDIEKIYPYFDLFVLPSVREPFGIVLLEAMASEVPVVATAAGGVLDFIEPGKNGELVPPRDENALAHQIDGLLSDPDRAKKLAQEGRRSVVNQYTIEKTVGRITDVYLAVAADKSKQ